MKIQKKEFIIAITGASGCLYALKLIEILQESAEVTKVNIIVSESAHHVITNEIESEWASFKKQNTKNKKIHCYSPKDFSASFASGNAYADAMIIVPCSMKTIAGIASGYSSNLILRAADVMLKENKKLILVPRETPLNYIHLKNLLLLKKAGAIILPAMPAFYFKPSTINDLIEFIVAKILKQLHITHSIEKIWNMPNDRHNSKNDKI
jgi:4-hydroxy-3-polyprenylbenzoate decarboxylase